LEDALAVHRGEVEIDENQIGFLRADEFEAASPVGLDEYLQIITKAEGALEKQDVRWVVVDDNDRGPTRRRLRGVGFVSHGRELRLGFRA
jgi:hypothetical protein